MTCNDFPCRDKHEMTVQHKTADEAAEKIIQQLFKAQQDAEKAQATLEEMAEESNSEKDLEINEKDIDEEEEEGGEDEENVDQEEEGGEEHEEGEEGEERTAHLRGGNSEEDRRDEWLARHHEGEP